MSSKPSGKGEGAPRRLVGRTYVNVRKFLRGRRPLRLNRVDRAWADYEQLVGRRVGPAPRVFAWTGKADMSGLSTWMNERDKHSRQVLCELIPGVNPRVNKKKLYSMKLDGLEKVYVASLEKKFGVRGYRRE